MIFSFFGSYACVYTTLYGFTQQEVGLCYIAVVVGAYLFFGYGSELTFSRVFIRHCNLRLFWRNKVSERVGQDQQ